MKKLYTFVLCFSTLSLFSQTFRLNYDAGYGFYSLKNIKTLQINLSKQIDILPVKTVIQFPNYINHSVGIGFYLDKKNLLEVNGSYLTTGGRNHLRDYSGQYKLDMILNAFQIGIGAEHIYSLSNKLDLNLNFKMGVIRSTLDTSEYFVIYNFESKASTGYYSQTNVFLEPNLSISYKIIKGLAIQIGTGYNLKTTTSSELIDWSGFRSRIGILCSF